MSEPLKRAISKRQRLFNVMSKVVALLGLVALAFLLMRPATTWPVGWIVFVVAVIQLSLEYSPTSEPAANRAPVSLRSTECRRNYRASGPYPCRKLSRKEL